MVQTGNTESSEDNKIPPLLWVSLAFLLGIITASLVPLSKWAWLLLALIPVSGFILSRRTALSQRFQQWSTLPVPVSILMLFLLLGAARYAFGIPDIQSERYIASYNDTDETWAVRGILIEPPDHRDHYVNLRIEVTGIRPEHSVQHSPVEGLLLARISPGTDLVYGDEVILVGEITTPPEFEGFSYRDYLARQSIYSYMPSARVGVLEHGRGNPVFAWLYRIKTLGMERVYRIWTDPVASLLQGILLGVETGIAAPVKTAFQETGTSHIIAISGFNITIVAGLLASIFGRIFTRRRSAFAAVIGIAFYTILVGADPAVVRAAIMGTTALLAKQIGRRQVGVNTLGITAAIMGFIDPQVLWDIGFQLSFFATLGLILYAEPFTNTFARIAGRWLDDATVERWVGPVSEFVLFTMAAQLTTIPISAYYFHQVSVSSLFANILILPVQSFIMILGGIALIGGMVWLPLGKFLGWLAHPFAAYTIWMVEIIADRFQGVIHLGDFSFILLVLYYTILFGLTFGGVRMIKWIKSDPERLKTAISLPLLLGMAIATFLVVRSAQSAPDGNLHLTLLDVDGGTAVLIESPDGRFVLVNGGQSTNLLSDGLGRFLPPFHKEIDYLIIASPDEENIAALPRNLQRFKVHQILWAGLPSPNRTADYLREAITEAQIPLMFAETGQSLDLSQGASIEVLSVGKLGASILVSWGDFRAILPIGCNLDDLDALTTQNRLRDSSVLLLAQGGYAPINPPEWIEFINPQLVLLSVSASDYQGRPDPELLKTIGQYRVLRTDRHGWISITTDGTQMWVDSREKEE